eukprot:UN24822
MGSENCGFALGSPRGFKGICWTGGRGSNLTLTVNAYFSFFTFFSCHSQSEKTIFDEFFFTSRLSYSSRF